MMTVTKHNGRYDDAEVAAYEAGKAFDYPADEEGMECVEGYAMEHGYDLSHFCDGFYSRPDGPDPGKYDPAYYDPDWMND